MSRAQTRKIWNPEEYVKNRQRKQRRSHKRNGELAVRKVKGK